MGKFTAYISQNKAGILIGAGMGSMVVATISAFRFGSMARDAIEERKEELQIDKLDAKETIKTVVPYAAPSILLSLLGIGCILGGNQIHVNRSAAAMAACTITENAFREYREQTKQVVGEKKEKDIREAAAKQLIESHSTSDIIVTGKGDCLCFDDVANQYFRSSKTAIEKVINRLNFEMMDSRSSISINDYCLALGLDTVLLGNDLGWTVDGAGIINPDIIAQIRNDEPCLVVTHSRREPKPLY